VVQAVVGEQRVDEAARAFDLGELAHPLQVCAALGVEILGGGPVQHQREHDLREEHGLQVRLRLHRLGQPLLDVRRALIGDDVALPVRPGAGADVADHHLAVPGQPAERRVDLAERERLATAEVGVVVAFEVVPVAGLPFEQAEKGERNAHARTIHPVCTSRIYLRFRYLPHGWTRCAVL
jgi:hypothetical protein